MTSVPGRASVFLASLMLVLFSGCGGSSGSTDPRVLKLLNEGVGAMGIFDFSRAEQLFQEAVQLAPKNHYARLDLGISILNQSEPDSQERALKIFKAALADRARFPEARYCAGLADLYMGRPARAAKRFEAVTQTNPEDAHAWFYLGQCQELDSDLEDSLASYMRSIELDPMLRSPLLGAQRVLQRLSREQEAAEYLQRFQGLADDPRARLAEFKYSRMGPLAMAIVPQGPRPEFRSGADLFAKPGPLVPRNQGNSIGGTDAITSVVDFDHDGRLDIVVVSEFQEGGSSRAYSPGERGYRLVDSPLPPELDAVRCLLWGDYDNDGLVDVYVCRNGYNILLKQVAGGGFVDVTERTGTADGHLDTVDGAFADFDHDGDLDIFCVNNDGPDQLLNNDRNGSFRPIAGQAGIDSGPGSRQIALGDIDRDRDLDIVVIRDEPPHHVWRNDLVWEYESDPRFEEFTGSPASAVVIRDLDGDGFGDLLSAEDDGSVRIWRTDALAFKAQPGTVISGDPSSERIPRQRLAVEDIDGNGTVDLVMQHRDRITVHALDGSMMHELHAAGLVDWIPANLGTRGPSILYAMQDQPLMWIGPGPERGRFAQVAFSGRDDQAQQMRSNRDGIGTHYLARVGNRTSSGSMLRSSSGPGQSLQPVSIGLGNASRIDYLQVDFPDGLFQTELNLDADAFHLVRETQRQVSSCPLLLAHDGSRWSFVSDVLGVGGIGFMIKPGTFSDPRPHETFLMPAGSIKPVDGILSLRLSEPMEEVCYLDSADLVAVDVPEGWMVAVDERMQVGGYRPTSEILFIDSVVDPVSATNDAGLDILEALIEADHSAVDPGQIDERFIGRLAEPFSITMEFDRALDQLSSPVLLIDGWVEYPYGQTMFAAWQAGAAYEAPTLEARDQDGRWHVVTDQLGYPAGMPRLMSFSMDGLPAGARALRLRTNMEIYWDRIRVGSSRPQPTGATQTMLETVSATLDAPGFCRRTTGPQRLPYYDPIDRLPLQDMRVPTGLYTKLGGVLPLVGTRDGLSAIFGPGEDIEINFRAPGPVPAGSTRWYVLDLHGWCKDMDLFTRDGWTVAPIPGLDAGRSLPKEIESIMQRRPRSGR